MIATILLLIAGLALVVFGADFLVDGASGIARKAGVSEFVIGLTIVGFGTSCPELVVSLTGALQGSSDIAIGNVIGSNIFNILLILGVTALISPVSMTRENRLRDIPVTITVTLVLLVCSMHKTFFNLGGEDIISRADGVLFLLLFAVYLWSCFKFDQKVESAGDSSDSGIFRNVAFVLLGFGGLIAGGQLFVDNSVELAKRLGASEKLIAITLLAGGTSFPELATCVVAGLKHKDQLALGNILGSNVFNILLILGCTSVIRPVSASSLNIVDAFFLLVSVLALLLFACTGKKDRIDRPEAVLLLLMELDYMVILFRS